MKYKRDGLESQFLLRTEPELRQLLQDFDDISKRWGLPEPILTCLGRTPAENKAVGGVAHSLHLWEADPFLPAKPPISRAADLSAWAYSPEQLAQALMWLRGEIARRGGRRAWELIHHDAGTGEHVHVAREHDPRETVSA